MSYSPKDERRVHLEVDQSEHGMLNGDARAGAPEAELDEVEQNLVRRYEDFSTVDWIQDSLHEQRSRRKGPAARTGLQARLDQLEGVPGAMWTALSRILDDGQTWVVISLVGVGIGISAALMSIMTVWLSDIKMGYCTTGWWLTQKFCCLEISDEGEGCTEWRNWGGVEPFRYFAYILFAGLFSFTAAFLVKAFAPYAAGSGISEIKCILGGFIIKGFLSAETFALKTLTMPLGIASGLSIGKEGPSVHVACSFGNIAARLFGRYDRSHLKMREIVTASSAAGVAVAFGSPIGGVLFAIEVSTRRRLAGHSSSSGDEPDVLDADDVAKLCLCSGGYLHPRGESVIKSAAQAYIQSMDPFRTGKLVLFQVSYDRDWHYFEIPAYILIGLFGGLYGAFVIKFNLQMAAFRRKNLAQHGVAEAVTLAMLTAVVGYLNRFLRIDMTESMALLFRECEGGGDHRGLCQSSSQWRMVNSLLLATIIRTLMIIVTYGCKVPCGIFVPSMAVGAYFGRMIGILVKALYTAYPSAPMFAACAPDAPCITPGTYAFLGAAAALGGITRLTVTVVVIMFELTGALTYILPTMIVLLVTKAVSDYFGGGGMADEMIRFNGFPFLEKEDKEDGDHAFVEPIANVMKKDIIYMSAAGVPLQRINEIVQSTSYQGFPVVRSEDDRTIIGFVRKAELRYALDRATRARHLSANATCTFHCISTDPDNPGGLLTNPDIVIPGRQGSVTRSPNPDAFGRTSGVEAEQVDFGQYVDETPLTVSPKMPLEIVMQLFRRMGVILVSHEGQLVGLVTVKDVLRHEAATHHRGTQSPPSSARPRGHRPVPSELTDDGWDSWSADESRVRGLELMLEEGYAWAMIQGSRVYNLLYRAVRGRGSISRETNRDPGFEYEMETGQQRRS